MNDFNSPSGDKRDPLYRKKHSGVPGNGGETAEHPRDASGLSLVRDTSANEDKLAQRAADLAENGYLENTHLYDVGDPRQTQGRGTWWDRARATSEYNNVAAIPQMPDDNTPNHTGGRSMSSDRRTHRMKYDGVDGFAIRMPSHTAMHRYADDLAGSGKSATFDIPVQAVGPNGHIVQGWVRATRLSRDTWSTSPLGMSPTAGSAMAEAVSAVAEARRGEVRSSVNRAGDLISRAIKREQSSGITPEQVNSSWIGAVGYDPRNATMSMTTKTGKSYSYNDVSPAEYGEFLAARSPGAVFAKVVGTRNNKKKTSAGRPSTCPNCSRLSNNMAAHMCPSGIHGAPTAAGAQGNEAARSRASQVLASDSFRRHLEGR